MEGKDCCEQEMGNQCPDQVPPSTMMGALGGACASTSMQDKIDIACAGEQLQARLDVARMYHSAIVPTLSSMRNAVAPSREVALAMTQLQLCCYWLCEEMHICSVGLMGLQEQLKSIGLTGTGEKIPEMPVTSCSEPANTCREPAN